MSGALPDQSNGAVQVRDVLGACINPAGVVNAYCPPATFTSTCPLTALPNDCTGKIVPSQINGIVSELLCFAATINPNGNWDCGSLCNLASNFAQWAAENKLVDGTTILGTGELGDEWHVSPLGLVNAMCVGVDGAKEALAACLISTDPGNQLHQGTDDLLYVGINPVAIATAICSVDAAADTLVACMLSTDVGNLAHVGTDGRIFAGPANPDNVVSDICGDASAKITLSQCLISTDALNALGQGADGLHYAWLSVPNRTAMKALDPTKRTPMILNEGLRKGVFDSVLLSSLTAAEQAAAAIDVALEGIYVISAVNPLYVYKRRFTGAVQVEWWGALPNTTFDSLPAHTAAYNVVTTYSGTTEGSLGYIEARGGKYRWNGSFALSKPVGYLCDNFIEYVPATGSALIIGATIPVASRNQNYDIDIRGIRAINGNLATPTGVNLAGCSGVEVRNCQFSRLRFGQIIAFTKYGFWGNSSNDVYPLQHCQDNIIYIEEPVVNGEGIHIESIDAALGAWQVNEVHVENCFANWINFNIPLGDNNSNNNHFHFNAMDGDTGGGCAFLGGGWNTYYWGYTNGTIALRATSQFNKLHGHNLTYTDAGSQNEFWDNQNGNRGITRNTAIKTGAAPYVMEDNYYANPGVPANNDNGIQNNWSLKDSAGTKVIGVTQRSHFPTVTAGGVNARLVWETRVGGVLAERLALWQGLNIDGATGGDQGLGTINCKGYYVNGFNIADAVGNLIVPTGKALLPQTAGNPNIGSGALPFNNLFIKSTGTLNFGNSDYIVTHSAGTLTFSGSIVSLGLIAAAGFVGSSGPLAGIGYLTGSGGAVTQITSRTTGVTLNKVNGQITTNNAALAFGATAKFTVLNSAVAVTDNIVLTIGSGTTTDQTDVKVQRVAAGQFDIVVANRHAATAETGAIVINFAIVKTVII